MRERTIASHFARAVLRGAQRHGYDYSDLLQQLGINPELLEEPRARIGPEPFTRLIQALWLALDNEYLGFGKAPSKPGSFAMMCHAVIHCRNLEKALNRGLLFYSLFPDAPRLTLTREDEMIRLSLDDSQLWDPDHFLTEYLLVVWHRFGSWLIGQRIRLEQATFSYPRPEHGAEYDLLFSCALSFSTAKSAAQKSSGAQSSLLFHSRYLNMPLLQDERTLKHFLERSPADLLARPDDGHSLTSQLRRLLSRDSARWPDLDAVATHLHISPQTLRRHLREEGTSFQELKDQLRRDIAIYHLSRNDLPLQQIAEQLGFSEPSAFHRAFKKWTGLTPGAYRAQES
ncbi:AraC family transcriptional regulator [Pseudomonas sp. WPR_5_2]|uniref:AraC family transcriptional regulator n=1 Tax=Pseudomonas sp. WPR_5_2 TaxID=1907371 RepID=UPI000EAD7F5F|nr:AraC family transcriptional regulator [Pseudomonas sp. WPR_5_2]RKS16311.1 AraC family transcriptional regulator [Pseudomonas sp. WPR_5_2]